MPRRPSIASASNNAMGGRLLVAIPNDSRAWYTKPHLVKLNLIMFSLVLFSSANGYDGSMMNGLQALPQWQEFMDHPTGAWLGFINAIQAFGAILGTFPCAWALQRYGRKSGIWVAYFFLVLATMLQTAAPNPATFIVARFFLGQTSQWFSTAAPLLITETAYPTHRSICTALYNCGWYVGSLLAAWATFGTRNYTTSWAWRIPSVLQLAIPVVSFPGFLMAPESPRYLVSMDRTDEAKNILVEYHNGSVHDAFIDYEIEEIVSTLRMEKEAQESTSFMDMLKTKGNRHRLLISITLGIFAQWNGVGVVSYYLALVLRAAGITDLTDQTLINGCMQIWNLIIAVGAAFTIDRFGRRKLFLISCAGMLVSYICITGFSGSFAESGKKSIGLAVIPFLFLYYGFYDIAFTPLLIAYPAEIWPYQLRSRGLSLTLFSTQLAVGVNIFVNPIALEAIGWKYYIVFLVLLVIISFTCWFCYPETKGHSLEAMAQVFDGENAATPYVQDILENVASGKIAEVEVTHAEKTRFE
ncbi:sugar transporter [Cadophora sp. DSE1049]|nr:sugar transporter [Cadophora sp. DSE1049]